MSNTIYGINGPVVTLLGETGLSMMETVLVGKDRLVGEVIGINDRQTTGGYVKLGAVASCDLGRLAQLRMGDRIRFEEISLRGAQRLLRARQREVAALRARLERLK